MITQIIELSCDHCDVTYAPTVDEITSLRRTRVGSMVAGWTRGGRGGDYCPAHQAPILDAIRELAGKRLTDAQIATRLRVHRTTVQRLRAANDIATGLGRVGRPSHGFRGGA